MVPPQVFNERSEQRDFDAEVRLISKVKHKNLVSLDEFCEEPSDCRETNVVCMMSTAQNVHYFFMISLSNAGMCPICNVCEYRSNCIHDYIWPLLVQGW